MNTIKTVIEALDREGFYRALKTLEEVEGIDREKRLLAVAYGRRVQHLMDDPRSIDALDVSERYTNGQATEEEFEKAKRAARHAYANAYANAAAAAAAAVDAAAYADAAAAAVAAAVVTEKAEREWQEAELRRVCECIEAGTDPYPRRVE